MNPLPQDQVQQTAQIVLAVLSDGDVKIPGNALEGIVSFKSLLRGILQGNLVICQADQPAADPPAEDPPASPTTEKKPRARKKRTAKKA